MRNDTASMFTSVVNAIDSLGISMRCSRYIPTLMPGGPNLFSYYSANYFIQSTNKIRRIIESINPTLVLHAIGRLEPSKGSRITSKPSITGATLVPGALPLVTRWIKSVLKSIFNLGGGGIQIADASTFCDVAPSDIVCAYCGRREMSILPIVLLISLCGRPSHRIGLPWYHSPPSNPCRQKPRHSSKYLHH